MSTDRYVAGVVAKVDCFPQLPRMEDYRGTMYAYVNYNGLHGLYRANMLATLKEIVAN